MASPTRFPSGVATQANGTFGGTLVMPDPTKVHLYMEDFDTYTAGEWTITTTEAGSGAATEALTNGAGGQLLLTNDDADDDRDFLQKVGESFLFTSGKRMWFKARFKLSDATQSDAVMGLQITDTTPLAVSDGVYFRKDDGDALLDFVVIKDSTATTSTGVATMADDTWIEAAFVYDGKSEIVCWVNDAKVASVATTNMPDDEELTVSFGVQNGAAAVKTMTVDYIMAAQER